MVELIAHRGGNSEAALAAVPAGTDTVEIDVHLHGGRLEVRHQKRVWGTSRHWERWYLVPPGTVVPDLASLAPLVAAAGFGLWIDAKGGRRALIDRVSALVDGPVTVSTKAWWILGRVQRVRSGRIRSVRSAGNRFELALLRFLPSAVALDGVVVHRRLLTARQVGRLRRRHGSVFTWSVPDLATARQLMTWGVDGLIIDDPDLIRALSTGGPE